jgi:hypothetical protein
LGFARLIGTDEELYDLWDRRVSHQKDSRTSPPFRNVIVHVPDERLLVL